MWNPPRATSPTRSQRYKFEAAVRDKFLYPEIQGAVRDAAKEVVRKRELSGYEFNSIDLSDISFDDYNLLEPLAAFQNHRSDLIAHSCFGLRS